MLNHVCKHLPRRVVPLLMAPLCLLLGGCVATTDSDGGTRFHYALWLPLLIFAAGLVCVPIGFLLRKSDGRLGWGLMIAPPLAALLLAPTYLLEGVFVDDKGFESRTGMLGRMKAQKVAFDDVKSIVIGEEESRRRRSTRRFEVLYLAMKSGETERFPLGDDVKIEAGTRILKHAETRGISIIKNQ